MENLHTIAEKVLSETFGGQIHLCKLSDIGGQENRSTIIRYELLEAPDYAPATVILKRNNQRMGRTFNEWASLEFLNHIEEIQPYIPRFYGGDRQLGFVILEDLGDIEKRLVKDILNGDDPKLAESCLTEIGPFLAYTHQDVGPHNWLYAESGLRIFDFEHGTFSHALLDGVQFRLRYTLWEGSRYPKPLQRRLERAYHEELATGCPQAADDTLFGRAVVSAKC